MKRRKEEKIVIKRGERSNLFIMINPPSLLQQHQQQVSTLSKAVHLHFYSSLLIISSLLLLLTSPTAVTADPNFPLLSGILKTFQVHACDGEELRLECTENTIIAISLVQYGLPIFNNNNHNIVGTSSPTSGSINLNNNQGTLASIGNSSPLSSGSASLASRGKYNSGGSLNTQSINNYNNNNLKGIENTFCSNLRKETNNLRNHQSSSPNTHRSSSSSQNTLLKPSNSVPPYTPLNVPLSTSPLSPKPSLSTTKNSPSFGSSLINGNNSNCISDSETLRYQLLQKVESSCRGKSVCTILTSPSSFGGIDPCPGTIKLIEVAYKCRPNTFPTKVSCEGDTMRLKCRQSSDRIAILSAFYGTTSVPVPECPPLSSSSFSLPSSSSLYPSSTSPSLKSNHQQQQQLRNNLTADVRRTVNGAAENVDGGGGGSSDGVCQASFATESVMSRCLAQSNCNITVSSETFGPTSCKRDGMRFHLKVIYACVTDRVLRLPPSSSSFDGSSSGSSPFVPSSANTNNNNIGQNVGGSGDYSGFVDAPRYDPSQENGRRLRNEDNTSSSERKEDINHLFSSSSSSTNSNGKRGMEEDDGNNMTSGGGHRHISQPNPILSSSSPSNSNFPFQRNRGSTNSPSSSLDSSSSPIMEVTRNRNTLVEGGGGRTTDKETTTSKGGRRRENEGNPSSVNGSSSFLSSSSSSPSEREENGGVKGIRVMTTRLEAIGSLDTSSSTSNGTSRSSGNSSKNKINPSNENVTSVRKVVSFVASAYNLFKVHSEEVMLFTLMAISASCLMASLVFLTMMIHNKRGGSKRGSSPKECSLSSNNSSNSFDDSSTNPISAVSTTMVATINTTGQKQSILKRSESSNLKCSTSQHKTATFQLDSKSNKRSSQCSPNVFDASNEQLLEDLQNEGLVRSPTFHDYKHEDKYAFLGNQLYQLDNNSTNASDHGHICSSTIDNRSRVQELNCANIESLQNHHHLIHNSRSLHQLNSYCSSNADTYNGVNLVYPLNHYPAPSTSSTPVSNCTSTTNTNSNHSHNLQLDLLRCSDTTNAQQLVVPTSTSYTSHTLNLNGHHNYNPSGNNRDSCSLIPSIIGGTLNRRNSRITSMTPIFPIATTSFAVPSNTSSFNSPSKEVTSLATNNSPLKLLEARDGSNTIISNVIHDNNGISNSTVEGGGGVAGSTLQRIVIGNENRIGGRF